MKVDKFIVGIVGITLLLLVALFAFGSNIGQSATVETDPQATITVEENNFDWGEIGINDGLVNHAFVVENTGTSPLKLYNVKTSCSCTTAQLKSADQSSKKFGMHDASNDVFEIPPSSEAEVIIEYDPLFHGPSGTGPISRTVTMQTNDPNNSQIQFKVDALVN